MGLPPNFNTPIMAKRKEKRLNGKLLNELTCADLLARDIQVDPGKTAFVVIDPTLHTIQVARSYTNQEGLYCESPYKKTIPGYRDERPKPAAMPYPIARTLTLDNVTKRADISFLENHPECATSALFRKSKGVKDKKDTSYSIRGARFFKVDPEAYADATVSLVSKEILAFNAMQTHIGQAKIENGRPKFIVTKKGETKLEHLAYTLSKGQSVTKGWNQARKLAAALTAMKEDPDTVIQVLENSKDAAGFKVAQMVDWGIIRNVGGAFYGYGDVKANIQSWRAWIRNPENITNEAQRLATSAALNAYEVEYSERMGPDDIVSPPVSAEEFSKSVAPKPKKRRGPKPRAKAKAKVTTPASPEPPVKEPVEEEQQE